MLSSLLSGLIWCACYTCACGLLGKCLARALASKVELFQDASAAARWATLFLLGQGILSVLWLLLSLCGWLSSKIVATVLVLILIAGSPLLRRGSIAAFARLKREAAAFWAESRPFKIIALFIAVLALMQGFNTLLPPGGGSDAEAFYLALPKFISSSHRLLPMPGGFELFSQIGLQGEMHFAALMSVSSTQAAKLFVWPTCLAIALMLVGLGSSVGLGRRGSYISLAILFTSTGFTLLIWDGKVDLFATAMGLCAYYWALQVSVNQGALALAGLFTGLALVAKFSFIPTLLPGVILIILLQREFHSKAVCTGKFWKEEVKAFSIFGIWMLLPFIPHFLKNAVLFGQPLAPFIGPSARAMLDQTWFSPQVTSRIVLTYPLTLVFGNYPMQHGNLSPLLLAFCPLALFIGRSSDLLRSPLFQLTLAGLVGTAIWLLLRPSVLAPRYMLATLLAFIPLAGRGAECALSAIWGGRIFRSVILFCCVGILADGLVAAQFSAKRTLGLLSRKYTECELSGGFCTASEAINRDAAPGDRVFMGGFSSYWLRSDLILSISSSTEQFSVIAQKTPEAAWDLLRRNGFRYILIYRATHSAVFELLDTSRTPPELTVSKLFELEDFVVYRMENLR